MSDSDLVAIEPQPILGKSLSICWMLHNFCNNRCSYCQPYNYNGSHRWLDLDKVLHFIDKMEKHYGHYDTKFLSFTGGEPTAWKDFELVVEHLAKAGYLLGLTTNGSRDLDFWKRIIPKLNWINISYHPEYPRDDLILNIMREFDGKGNLAVRLMMHVEQEMWNRSLAMADKIKSLPTKGSIFTEYVTIQDNFGHESKPTDKYSSAQKEFLARHAYFNHGTGEILQNEKKNIWNVDEIYTDGSRKVLLANDLVVKSKVNFRGWTCHIGLESLFIDHFGDVYRAGCQQGGKMGNIFDEVIPFPTKPLICAKSFCPCATDIHVKKNAPFYQEQRQSFEVGMRAN